MIIHTDGHKFTAAELRYSHDVAVGYMVGANIRPGVVIDLSDVAAGKPRGCVALMSCR